MNSKNIAKSLNAKLTSWINSVDDPKVKKAINENAIVTGGALVSLLTGEEPHDYDIYFKTLEACDTVARYYANKWNESHPDKPQVEIQGIEEANGKDCDRVRCFIKSAGVAMEEDDENEPNNEESYASENEESPTQSDPAVSKPKYRPIYFSSNAISLSDKIQIVIRFWGPIEEIHKNYDFEHCKCSYDFAENKVNLPVKSLECIINKELVYTGSKYPLCSIIRTRKFIERGYHINAGQYVKMAWQLNKLDLSDLDVFKDQLMGVDSVYFNQAIEYMARKKEENPEWELTTPYLFEIIDKIF